MRVLDLGCGSGKTPSKLGLPDEWDFIGCDINAELLKAARRSYPSRQFHLARGESLPYAASSFDRVIANVSLPYMRIHDTIREIHRVLRPQGTLWISYHPPSATLSEMRSGFVGRIPVFLRGMLFHMTGRSFGESFQTRRGLRLALRHFENVEFSRDAKRWIVTAQKPASLALDRSPKKRAA